MSIKHDQVLPGTDKPVVFAQLGGFTCSICAPNSFVKAEIEAFAAKQFPGEWLSVDKSQLEIGIGTMPTPNPCNHHPDARTHWFMMRVPTDDELQDGIDRARREGKL